MAEERCADAERGGRRVLAKVAAGHSPHELAQRLAEKNRRREAGAEGSSSWRRETFTLPRQEARAKAHECFDAFPKAAYMTEIEFWRELSNDLVEFTIRRLPTAG